MQPGTVDPPSESKVRASNSRQRVYILTSGVRLLLLSRTQKFPQCLLDLIPRNSAGRIISSMRSVPEQVAGPQHRTHREGVALKHSRVYTHLNSMRKAGVKCTTLIAKMLRFRLLRPPSENAEYPACFEALTRPKPGDRRLYSNLSFINQIKILLGGVERLATMVKACRRA